MDNKASRSVYPLISPCSGISGEPSPQGDHVIKKGKQVTLSLFREVPTEIGEWTLEKLVLIV